MRLTTPTAAHVALFDPSQLLRVRKLEGHPPHSPTASPQVATQLASHAASITVSKEVLIEEDKN